MVVSGAGVQNDCNFIVTKMVQLKMCSFTWTIPTVSVPHNTFESLQEMA